MTDLERRVERLEYAMTTLAWWLVQAQTGFGQTDARGIDEIVDGRKDHAVQEFAQRRPCS